MANVLILSGNGRYADPWHPFDATSAIVADLLRDAGHDVEVSGDVEERLADLDCVDLLVVNAGNPTRHGLQSPTAAAARDGLHAYRVRGGGVLSLHVSAGSLPEVPEWREIMGGHWEQGVTMHPDNSLTTLQVAASEHPVVAGLDDFQTFDERYSWLVVADDVEPLLFHEHDGVRHPILWTRTDEHGGRVVYDALGHDPRAYESAGTRSLITRSAAWILDQPHPE